MESPCPIQEFWLERDELEQRGPLKGRIPQNNVGSRRSCISRVWRRDQPQDWWGQQSRERFGTHAKKTRKRKQTRGTRGGKKKKKRILGQGIHNLSNVQFTDDEIKVLDLRLKFAPDKTIDKFEVYIDLQKCIRTLNIKKHFALNKGNRMLDDPEFLQTNLRNNLSSTRRYRETNVWEYLKRWWKTI